MYGNLGSNSISLQSFPEAVLGVDGGLAKDFIQIGVGQDHTCAIEDITFIAYRWGTNLNGQIGNSFNQYKFTGSGKRNSRHPIKFIQIDAGKAHSCGIEDSTQKAFCWGGNYWGELGDNTQISKSTPVKVKGVGGGVAIKFRQIAAGSLFTCGLEVGSNKAYCWGFNFVHKLGNGSTAMQILTSVAVSGVGGGASLAYSQIATGSIHACAIEVGTQKAYCWAVVLSVA